MQVPPGLEDNSISLKHLGLSYVAWLIEDAFEIIKIHEMNNSFILGGDVLSKTNGLYKHNYDSWHFEPENGDAAESIRYAKQYLNKYPKGDFAFVIVADNSHS